MKNLKQLAPSLEYEPSTSDGLILKKLRIEEYISQKKIYRSGKYTQSHISGVENGKIAPSLEMIRDYANELGLDFYDVLLKILFAYKQRIEEHIDKVKSGKGYEQEELSSCS